MCTDSFSRWKSSPNRRLGKREKDGRYTIPTRQKRFSFMKCKCGSVFDINPLGADGAKVSDMTPSSNELESMTLNLMDVKTDDALVLVAECPFCGSMRFRLIHYYELLELPKPDSLEELYKVVGASQDGADSENLCSSE